MDARGNLGRDLQGAQATNLGRDGEAKAKYESNVIVNCLPVPSSRLANCEAANLCAIRFISKLIILSIKFPCYCIRNEMRRVRVLYISFISKLIVSSIIFMFCGVKNGIKVCGMSQPTATTEVDLRFPFSTSGWL